MPLETTSQLLDDLLDSARKNDPERMQAALGQIAQLQPVQPEPKESALSH
jgi:hypothetical protein